MSIYCRMDEIRDRFAQLHLDNLHSEDGTIEIIGASFIADQPTLFGQVNHDYVQRELQWYESRSLNVNDIPGGPPAIWKQVASKHDNGGWINSNYGYLLYDEENGSQYAHVLAKLSQQSSTRQAVAVYTRPSIHLDATEEGMSDFICTNAVQYLIRDGVLHAIVQMRSNDAIFGYRNDWAWQRHVLQQLHGELLETMPGLQLGDLIWQVGSLHVYPRHFHLLGRYADTGEWDVPISGKD